MSITIERVVEATPEVGDLIQELNDVLGAVYEEHQRHGLAIEQLFEPNLTLLCDAAGRPCGRVCGGVALFEDYAEVKRMYTRPRARGRGIAKAIVGKIEDEARAGRLVLRLETGIRRKRRSVSIRAWGFGQGVRSVHMWRCLPATSRPASFSKKCLGSSND